MSKLHLAAWAMLVAALPALSTGARAAPGFPHAIAAGAAHADYRLVQYGGGGGGCDDDCPRPQHNGGGGGNGAAAAGAIINLLGNIARQHQLEQQQKNNEMQRRAIDEQNRRNRAIDDRNRRNRAVEDQNRRNRAAEDERNRRAKQDELEKLRAERQKLEQERKEEAERLNEQRAADDQRNKQEKAEKEYEAANGDDGYGYGPGAKVDDKLENNVSIVIRLIAPNGLPELPDVTPLHVNKDTQLYPSGYANLPGDRDICTGRTASGCWLRTLSVSVAGGGTRSVCMSYCPKPPKIPPRVVVLPPTPAPTPQYVVPAPTPQYVVPAPTPQYDVPKPTPQYVVPAPKPKPMTPAVITVQAYPSVVPAPRRKLTPAVTTVQAYPSVVPTPRRKLTPAVTTVQAYPSVVPEPRRKLTPAVTTVQAYPSVVPEPRRKLTPAVTTVQAYPSVVPEPVRKLTPAVTTVQAYPSVVPEPERKLTPAVNTVESDPYVVPKHANKQHAGRELTPAVTTVKASDRPPVTPAVLTVTAHPFTKPDPKRPQPKSETPGFAFDAIDADKPQDKPNPPESRQAKLDGGQLDEATPTGPLDSKGCTAAGVKPLDQAVSEPLAKFNPPVFSPREVVTTAISGIPDGIGGVLSAATKLIWQDDSSRKLFDAMKSYVDQVVPAAIDKYDTTQLSNDLTAIRNILSWYDSTRTASTKGQHLSELVTQLETMKPRFLNPRSPKSTLAEFVAFGTLHLSALKELYDHYDKYYPFDSKDPNAVSDHQNDRRVVQTKLNAAIKEYQDHIKALRPDIIADRLSKLRVNDRGEVHSVFWSVDAPDVLVSNDYFSAKDDFCDWQLSEHKDDQGAAQADLESRKAAVRAAYNKLIDELTAPIARWKPI